MRTAGCVKGRRGFTLVEVLASTIILAVVVIGISVASQYISRMKTESRNEVFLTTHNLNCMERLRQMCYDLMPGEELLSYYPNSMFGSSEINTEIYIDMSTLGQFRVYDVRIESRMIGFVQILNSHYTFTNIGGFKQLENLDGGAGYLPDEELGAESGDEGGGG